jgi:Uma2 family endonuclease
MALVVEKNLTLLVYDDLSTLPSGNYEIIDGVKFNMAPTGFLHGLIEGRLYDLLEAHLSTKGYVATGEVGVLISRSPLRVRGADIVYITKESYPKPPVGILEKPPELVVEILSPNNTAEEMNAKLKDYLSIGVPVIVYVDSENEMVTKFLSNGTSTVYSFSDSFPIYDGLSIVMKDILG